MSRVTLRVDALAALLGGTVEGDGTRELTGVAGLEDASPDDLSFLANRRYARKLAGTRAGAVLVGRKQAAGGTTVIRVDDPYLALAEALRIFRPVLPPLAGVHASAVVEGTVDGADIRAFAYVGPGAVVGEGTTVYPHAYVGAGARVGRDCTILPGAVVMDGCTLGDRCVLQPGAVVGGDGFGYATRAGAPAGQVHVKVPQVGSVVLGDDVELGANACVDRGALGDTRVGSGSKLDNLVQVGHGAQLGPDCVLVAYAGVSGSTRLGRGVVLAARAGVLGHLELGDGVQVGALSMVTKDVPAGEKRSGIPAIDHATWLRETAGRAVARRVGSAGAGDTTGVQGALPPGGALRGRAPPQKTHDEELP